MKKQLMALLIVVVLVLGLSFAACNTPETNVIEGYVFDKNGMAIYDDLVLPKTLGDEENPTQVKWTSSDSSIIKITERESDFLAEIVNFPDEAKNVKLTLSDGKNEKEFTVTVNPLAASDFARAYSFPQLHSKVAVDFELDTTVQYKGKTATISWEVVTGAPYIQVDGNKCIVDHQNESNSVSLRATFTYGTGKTATRTYDFTVTKEPTHEEAMHRWHTIAPMPQDLPIKGYVLAIIASFDAQYKNASFFMVCEDYCSAYYVYRVKMDEANGAKLAVGNYVTITGTSNSIYNGLYETSAGGNCVVDDTKKIKEDYVYAIDNDLFADAPTASYHVSDLVSLTNWTVKSVESKPADTDKNLMVLTKNGIDITLRVSKNVLETATKDAPNFADIAALCDTVKVNDVVSVKGLLGYYNGYQLFITKASDLTKTAADAEGTVYPGSEVKQTIADIKKAITDNGLDKLVTAGKTVTMPTGSGNISVVYSKYSDSNAVALNDNVITVTPGKAEDVNIKATIKYGDSYTTMVIFNIKSEESEGQSDADIVAEILEGINFDVTAIALPSEYEVTVANDTYPDATIEWSVEGNPAWAVVEAGGYQGKQTYFKVKSLPEEAAKIKLVATVTSGEESDNKSFTIDVSAMPANALILTTYSLNLPTAYDQEVTEHNDGTVKYSACKVANFGDGIQVQKNDASIITVTDLGSTKKIAKIVINLNTTTKNKSLSAGIIDMAVSFGNGETFADAQKLTIVAGQSAYEFTPATNDCTQFKIVNPASSSITAYIWSIVVYFAD